MNLFSKNVDEKPQDVKMLRDKLLQCIKDQLSKAEGGEGNNIKGLHLFVAANNEDRHQYESAVYFHEEEKLKEEIQRIADDYSISLPSDWALETNFVDTIPSEAFRLGNMDVGLFIRTQKKALTKYATAEVRILNGETEQELYTIHSTDGKINIGREKRVQNADGFFRINNIAFPSTSTHESNKYVSRQHAHIQFDNDAGLFYLYADEGGIPPGNKVKVRTKNSESPIKLYSTQIGHALQDGDQIMLGESAILEFMYKKD